MGKSEKLIPCPFCGGKGLTKEEHSFSDVQSDDDHHYFWIECKDCGARTKITHFKSARYGKICTKEIFKAIREVTEAWNKRV